MKNFKLYLEDYVLLTEATDVVQIKPGHVLISDYVKQHISSHNDIGIGSVFNKNVDMELISNAAKQAPVADDGGAYTVTAPGIGYNLVLPIDEALSLPDAEQTTVVKDERGQEIEVPAVKTSANIDQFATDQLTVIIRPSNPDYLPDDVKNDPEILQAIENNESYSILTAFPGDPNIPPASEWNNQFAVILPS